MAANIKQVYDANPTTIPQNTDLLYLGQSPYGLTHDSAILYSDLAIAFRALLSAGAGINYNSGTGAITNTGVTQLTGTANQITFSAATGNITASLPQNIATSSSPTFTGLTLSGLTEGSVLFAGAGGIISQDNANLFWDNTNNWFGIGTNTPEARLNTATTNTAGRSDQIFIDNDNTTAAIGKGSAIFFRTLDAGSARHNQAYIEASTTSADALNSDLVFGTILADSALERLRILSTGNIGVIQSLPGSRFSINGNLAVGVTYSALGAPTNGAIIEGQTFIGASSGTGFLQMSYSNTGTTLGANTNFVIQNPYAFAFLGGQNIGTNIAFVYRTKGDAIEAPITMSSIDSRKTDAANTYRSYLAFLNRSGNGAGSDDGLLEGMRLTYDKKLGVGLTLPASAGHFYEDTSAVNESVGLTIEQDGSGDALCQYLLTGSRRWVTGIDNSDSDAFKFSATTDLANATTILTTGGNFGLGVTGVSSINATLHVNGSQAGKITVPGAYPYSILTTDYLVAVDTSSARSIILPTSAAGNSGVTYIVKDITGSAATNAITVTVNGGGNIDGAASSVLNIAYEARGFYSNGTQWYAI